MKLFVHTCNILFKYIERKKQVDSLIHPMMYSLIECCHCKIKEPICKVLKIDLDTLIFYWSIEMTYNHATSRKQRGSLLTRIWRYSCYANINNCSSVTGILILIGSLGYLKELQTINMILGKCKFPNSFLLLSLTYVVGSHWNCLYEAIPMCTYNFLLFNK